MSYVIIFLILSIDFIQCSAISNPFSADSFLELSSSGKATTTTTNSCISNGALAGAIVGTIILCGFIGFLIWLIYLRPKFQGALFFFLSKNKMYVYFLLSLKN